MSEINLILPHQLFEKHAILNNGLPIYLLEEYLFFSQYKFHKRKIAFHRATMNCYHAFLQSKGLKVLYIESKESISDIRLLLPKLSQRGIAKINFIDPVDFWLGERLIKGCEKSDIEYKQYDSPLFLNTVSELADYFKPGLKKFFQTNFYKAQRNKYSILLEKNGKPIGGKWSFDRENRKKYPRNKTAPVISYPETNNYWHEAKKYVEAYFNDNPGDLDIHPLYPVDFESTRSWLKQFLENRFVEFGPYEDAIVADQSILNHSVLTPMLNVGLITPEEIIDRVLEFAEQKEVPINSLEGFIRQVIGWREFIRGMYVFRGVQERTTNYWNFNRKIPRSFYNGTTGIDPVDITIKKVLKTGYCHHIERLMVLGNFMLLCEFHPDEVYRWFMELFIDAYDWVMVPNVYGMSQFADGGLMATKPYISGSNYLIKMSDYKKGSWQEIWDGLFWRFMHVHRDFFMKNPRLAMLVRTFDKWPAEKQKHLMVKATSFLEQLDEGMD